MSHRHRKIRERGPYGCAGNVRYVYTCSCGAEKRECFCHQCKMQGTNKSEWYMPTCGQCNFNHPADTSCIIR